MITALMLISLLDQLIPGARYVKYLALPLSVAFLFNKQLKIATLPGLEAYYLYFLLMMPYLALTILQRTENTFDDTIFLLTYLLPLALIKNTGFSIQGAFIASAILFGISSAGKLGNHFTIDFTTSTSSFEHGEFGFIFAFFLVYFITTKNLKLAMLALVLTILSLKRIALIGAIAALAVFYTQIEKIISRRTIALLAATLNVFTILLIQYSVTDDFNDLVFSLTEQSANQFMMGRTVLYSYILKHTSVNWLYGLGPGGVYSYATTAFESSSRVLLHSDILKLAIEYGLIFLFAFIYLLYNNKRVPLEQIVLLNIIMLTDNPLIYSAVMFMFFMIVADQAKTAQPT